jgi:hypothetical protein
MPHPRLKRTFEQNEAKLALLAPRWGCADASEVFNLIAACDPSDDPAYGHNKKRHLDWLVRQAVAHELYIANLGSTQRMLRLYECDRAVKPLTYSTTPNALEERYVQPLLNWLDSYLNESGALTFWMSIPGFASYDDIKPLFVLDKLMHDADPAKGRNLTHIMRWLCAEGNDALYPEDLPQVRQDLDLYQRKRQSITPPEQRNLNSYKTYREFGAVMRRYRPESEPQNRQLVEDTAIGAGHAKLVAETTDFRLIHITNIEGAQQLGKGSRWCTRWDGAGAHHNRFNTYQNGLLYLRLFEANTVQQLHFGHWQFMDAEDAPLIGWVPYAKGNPALYAALKPFALDAISSGALTHTAFANLPIVSRDTHYISLFQNVANYIRGDEQLETAFAAKLNMALYHPIEISPNLNCAAASFEICSQIPTLWTELRRRGDWIETSLARAANKAQPDACEKMLKLFASDPVAKTAACAALPAAMTFLLEERLTDDARGIWKLVDYCKTDKDYATAVKLCSTRGLQVTHGVAERLMSRLAHKIRQRRQPE